MTDPKFGELKWTYRDVWATPIAIKYFKRFGTRVFEDVSVGQVASKRHRGQKTKSSTKAQIEAKQRMEEFGRSLASTEQSLFSTLLGAFEQTAARSKSDDVQQKNARSAESGNPLDSRNLFREGKFLLTVDTGGKRKLPVPAQHQAWQEVLNSGDALWEETTERVLGLYQSQRAVRVHWWSRAFGKKWAQLMIPKITDRRGLRELIWPVEARVHPVRSDQRHPHIGIHFICTWTTDGFGVLLGEGRVLETGIVATAFSPEDNGGGASAYPEFGVLWRALDDEDGERRLEGSTPCEPFRAYANIAAARAAFREDQLQFGTPRLELDWGFVRGMFDIIVHTDARYAPTNEQTKAWRCFNKRQHEYAAKIVKAVFNNYQLNVDRYRKEWTYDNIDDLVPRLGTSDGLSERMQLRKVHVHTPDANGGVALGFQFDCSWSYDGCGVLWRDGRVLNVGTWDDAESTHHH